MLKFGLTGGIASGKSSVAGMLRELGFPVLDADSISHRLMEPGQPAQDEILREFGPDLADTSGRIDRRKLAAIAFAAPDKLTRLNAAGLDYLQISVDNLAPDEVSKKSLKVLDQKLLHH